MSANRIRKKAKPKLKQEYGREFKFKNLQGVEVQREREREFE